MKYDIVVFDTAPTGHTLKLLKLPDLVQDGLQKLINMKSQFSSLVTMACNLFKVQGMDLDTLTSKLDALLPSIERINAQFKDPRQTTFVCVCIAEFLSVYVTERLVQELLKLDIDTHNIIVNNVLYPDEDKPCGLCRSRCKMQEKFLSQITDLYEDFHVTKLPLLDTEVRGVHQLKSFSENMVRPYSREEHPLAATTTST